MCIETVLRRETRSTKKIKEPRNINLKCQNHQRHKTKFLSVVISVTTLKKNSHGPSLILLGVSRITHSSPDLKTNFPEFLIL